MYSFNRRVALRRFIAPVPRSHLTVYPVHPSRITPLRSHVDARPLLRYHSSSDMTSKPNSRACSNFLPGFNPTTTTSVFLDIDPVTRAPSSLAAPWVSSRFILRITQRWSQRMVSVTRGGRSFLRPALLKQIRISDVRRIRSNTTRANTCRANSK